MANLYADANMSKIPLNSEIFEANSRINDVDTSNVGTSNEGQINGLVEIPKTEGDIKLKKYSRKHKKL